MCNRKDGCAFYLTYNGKNDTYKKFQLLIDTYCNGDFKEVCRRKAYKGETGFAHIAELGPNGHHVMSNKRLY